MKTDILKALRRLRLPALALAAFLASCTSELAHEPAPGGGSQAGEALVTLRLQVPGAAAAGKTRAVGDNAERTVNDLYILAFKVDGGVETFDYYAVARKGTEDLTTGVSKWTASLRPKDYEQTFVMIANAQGTPGDVNTQIAALVDDGAGGTSVGEDKETVLEKLTDKLTADEQTAGFNAKGDNDHHAFTMYGQTAATKITLGQDPSLTVALHRIVARVNMAFTGDATTNFTASKVYLCNFTDRARVIPNGLGQTTGADYEPAATIPADAQKLPAAFDVLGNIPTYTVANNNKVENTIYLFETSQPAADATDAHLKRPCLVVQGTYEGYEGYYRVDFATQDATTGDVTYRDIIRNHSYNFTVTNVSGRGSSTLQEAMETKASNLTADMILWDDNVIGNIDFEGDHVLGISTNSYELIKEGGIRLLQVRATTNVTWTANIYAANADGSADVNGTRPEWIKFADKDGTALTNTHTTDATQGIDALQDIYFTVAKNDEGRERQAVVRLTDERGRLSVEAVVTQNLISMPLSLTVTQNGMPVTEMEFTGEDGTSLGSIFINYGPKDVVLTWTIEEDPANGTMDIADVDINTTSTGGQLEGEVIAATDNAQTVLNATAAPLSAADLAKSFATRTATLTLIAQHPTTGEVQVQTIRLFQKKYGLEIDRTEVLCGGQEALIYVKGNMPWQVVNISGQGYQDAMANGLISEYTVMDEGDPSETSFSTSSCVRISTKQAPLIRESHKAQLNFQHRTQADKFVSKEITFRGGMLAIDEWVNNNKITKIYEVYGPVDRSLNTKDEPYEEGGTEVAGAVMMDSEQAYYLQRAVSKVDWGICKDSELIHEFRVLNLGQTIYKSGSYDNFEAPIPFYLASKYDFYEYLSMTSAGPKGTIELTNQKLLEITRQQGDAKHTHMLLKGTEVESNNLIFNIYGIGYAVKDKYNRDEFKYYHRDVKWPRMFGSADGTIPTRIYGTAWEATFKPDINNQDAINGNYKVLVTRFNSNGQLDLKQYRNQNYPTYYFKLLKTE